MNARFWTTLYAVTLLAFPGTTALAQRGGPWPMVVVVRLNDGKDPWEYGPRMASATGMQMVGVSVNTNTVVFTVPNETDRANGVVAQRNQKTILDGFPGVVMSYNYGANYPAPKDLQASRPQPPPPVVDDRRRGDDRRGDDRRGDDRRGDDRGRRGPPTYFSDRDRMAVRDWYYGRRDYWTQVRAGTFLDARLRDLGYPAPPELARELGPVYRGGQYLIIGDNLVMVDNRYYVLDVIRFSDIRDDRRR